MRTNETRIKLQDVIMDAVVKETPNYKADVTSKPVEQGQDISDHVKFNGASVSLSGSMVNDAANKLEILRGYQREGKLLKYIGRNAFENMVITSINTNHSKENSLGFDYDIDLEQVRIAKPKTFEINVANPETKEQDQKTGTRVKEVSNAGRQQLQSTNPNSSERVGA